MSHPPIIISDANIIIDLDNAGLLDNLFRLPFDIQTTDFIIHELRDEELKERVRINIPAGKLSVISFSPAEMAQLFAFHNEEKRLSIADRSVWFLAKRFTGKLLTGDRKLRKCAEDDGIEVSGVLYIFDTLINCHLINQFEAIEALHRLMKANCRLPREACESMLEKWASSSQAS